MTKKELSFILKTLDELYPKPKPFLNFKNAYEMLMATMLSAQSTDKQVNKVTPTLFEKYPTAKSLAEADVLEVYNIVKSCGFRSKAERLVLSCKKIVEDFAGEVPSTIEELLTLPGVGRKTADVVLANAFDVPTIAVDTHVFRVSNRLGLANAKNAEKTEFQLMDILPKDRWVDIHHQLILLGRNLCKARKPLCRACPFNEICKWAKEQEVV